MKLRLLAIGLVVLVFAPAASAMRWLDDPPPPDTTPPVITTPGSVTAEATSSAGATVNYDVSAVDDVDGTVPVNCSPASGSTFGLGTTSVDCTAKDAADNIANASFDVTVHDTTPPALGPMPADISDSTENPGGKVENYSLPSATDSVDTSPSVSCSPASGANFPVGTTTVHCHATDDSGNSSGDGTFTVTINLVDHTAPTLHLPASFSVDTENPSGRAVSYSATASDNVDQSPTVSCNPGSGSTFPLGSTTVNCTATDDANNQSSGSFTITVNLVDHTPPVFSNVPANKLVEANGPSGSIVTYTTPTATDALDGPIAGVSCAPASGSKFSIATTTVTCNATDSHGNTGHASFTVTVHDTTAPTLIIPAPRSVYATTPTGIPDNAPAIVSFVSAASATDIVDPHPAVRHNVPSFVPVGVRTVTFSAFDASGNSVAKSVNLTVLPQPPPGTPPLPIPPAPKTPADVPKLRAVPGSGTVKLTWGAVPGAKQYIVYRSESAARKTSGEGHGQVVYTGTKTTYIDRGLVNGTEYRYVVVTEDASGNRSAGEAIVVSPRRDLLRSPKNGARLKKAPKLMWARDAEASYYNAQLMRNGVKILSVWPIGPSYKLKRSWTFDGKKYKLKAGVYQWFVWPGYGPRSQVAYGQLLGSRTFRIVG
jgi:HYR domain